MNARSAYTLIELVVSMVAATALLGGLASALFITSTVFDTQLESMRESQAAEIQTSILRDLSRATSFSFTGKETVTFTVPDEDGDNNEETISYSYDKDTDQLSVSYNGATDILLENVKDSDFTYLQRVMEGSVPALAPYDPNDWGTRWGSSIELVGVAASATSGSSSINLSIPPGTADGDLLIAVVTANDGEGNVTAPGGGGWNPIFRERHGENIAMIAVWKIASSEPSSHTFSHGEANQFVGSIMQFRGHNAANPIHSLSDVNEGNNMNPECASVSTSTNETLILRLGGFDDDDITFGEPGLNGHTPIFMSSTSGVSSGAGYMYLDSSGNSGTADFNLTKKEQYITISVAIAPE